MQVSQKGFPKKKEKKGREREKERGKGGHVVCPTMLQLNNIINTHIIVLNALLTGLGLGYDYFQILGLGLPPLEMCAKTTLISEFYFCLDILSYDLRGTNNNNNYYYYSFRPCFTKANTTLHFSLMMSRGK
jgi:hypothetical protein